MIVVDTNILVYLHMDGDKTSEVEDLYLSRPDWAAASVWQHEFLNVLCTCQRLGQMGLADCIQLFEHAATVIGDNTFEVSPLRILETAQKTGCSGYDSQFVALAEDLGVPLYTYDKKILKLCPGIAQTP
jgi:predicted nucleic acid-binding protein